MTRRFFLTGIAILFAGISLIAAPEEKTTMVCTLTNETVEKCCCEKRDNGKLFCTKAQKEVETCCCEEVEK